MKAGMDRKTARKYVDGGKLPSELTTPRDWRTCNVMMRSRSRLLCHGFVRVRCGDCGDERLVAFSCKTRGFCPSCTSRRMTSTAAHLVDRVLPTAPYRQWVLSLPRQVRSLLARDHGLLGELVGIFLRKVFAWQRRRARSQGIAKPHTGAVTFVQRFGSLLNLGQRLSGQPFHREVRLSVFVDTQIVDRDDRRVVEPSLDLCFAEEPFTRRGVGRAGAHPLDRDLPPDLRVICGGHLAHAAASDQRTELVAAQHGADEGGLLVRS